MTTPPPDHRARLEAATNFDRNVVVTAGAGTGKTTLLVDRCVNLLMRNKPEAVKVTEFVALTFTNKAANEMKARLRDRLERLAGDGAAPAQAARDAGADEVEALCRRNDGLKPNDVRERAGEALQHLERAHIGTIHHFAASLLRLYPLQTGLDPGFRDGDERLLKGHFDTAWALWLDGELSSTGPGTGEWKRALANFTLDRLGALARKLCAEDVDLDRLQSPGAGDGAHPDLLVWLRKLDATARNLSERYPPPGANALERALPVALGIVTAAAGGGAEASAPTLDDLRLLEADVSRRPKNWTPEDHERARDLIADARRLAAVDPRERERLCALLAPFARETRADLTRKGLVTFDGLLVRARDLLRDHPRIREDLKSRFKAILVDEFQDTDPLQYEILLWLCEERAQHAGHWRDIRLTPGKLFVVGDPKQSIYGFRGADIEAYLKVVQEVIEFQDGAGYPLTANFRSDPRILDVVNDVFGRLIEEKAGLQPEYNALQSGLQRPAETPDPERNRPPVRVRRVTMKGRMNVEQARLLEAASLARWLDEEVLRGRTLLRDRDGKGMPAMPGHVAFLFRGLTNVAIYLEALRRRGIGYVVTGERSFFDAQEVQGVVNLLRAIDNPQDRLALVGVLRSPLGGHDDNEIHALGRKRLLDYRAVSWTRGADLPGTTRDLYRRLLELHREAPFLEAGQAVALVLRELPLFVLAAGTGAGAQAVANLEKVRLVAEETGGTLKEVVAELERRMLGREPEPESPLEEEGLDAVRIMSIHAAKGLEFPIMVLADALAGSGRGGREDVQIQRDWATGLTGFHVGDLWDLPGVFIEAKRRQRDEYERRRLLYVAMTRPRDRLVISFANQGDGKARRDSLLALLEDGGESELTHAGHEDRPIVVPTGDGQMEVEVVVEEPEALGGSRHEESPAADADDGSVYEDRWRRRREVWEERNRQIVFRSPTGSRPAGEAGESETERRRGRRRSGARDFDRDTALKLGVVAHGVLEHWDFQTARIAQDLADAIALHTAALPAEERAIVIRELKDMWPTFTESTIYDELRTARIVGREMPFLMPWNGQQIMEGRIDLVYERDGRLYVADYKTDRLTAEEIGQTMDEYDHQASVYTEAVQRCLDRDVAAFRLILLRLGRAVDVPLKVNGGSPVP